MTAQLQRILYVEDDADIREITNIALSDIGEFEVLVCESGVDALAAIPDFRPDLLMLDVMMPGMDGPTLLRRIRGFADWPEPLRATPCVFITARIQGHDVQELLDQGAIGVIAKPFDPMTLADQVRDLWNDAANRG